MKMLKDFVAQLQATEKEKIEAAVELGFRYGNIDGSHHKTWVIDQMLRILLGERYEAAVMDACSGEDGPDTYEWDTGIAP
jgi:hypothetical protein